VRNKRKFPNDPYYPTRVEKDEDWCPQARESKQSRGGPKKTAPTPAFTAEVKHKERIPHIFFPNEKTFKKLPGTRGKVADESTLMPREITLA